MFKIQSQTEEVPCSGKRREASAISSTSVRGAKIEDWSKSSNRKLFLIWRISPEISPIEVCWSFNAVKNTWTTAIVAINQRWDGQLCCSLYHRLSPLCSIFLELILFLVTKFRFGSSRNGGKCSTSWGGFCIAWPRSCSWSSWYPTKRSIYFISTSSN